MQNEKLNRVLGSTDKEVQKARGVLSRVFRKIMADVGVNTETWPRYMKHYLQDPKNRIAQNSKDISSARGNLVKELLRPEMSWKVFMKGLRFLGPKRVKLNIECEWWNGKTTVHEIPVMSTEQLTTEPESALQQNVPETAFPVVPVLETSERLKAALERSHHTLKQAMKK